jgi:hypothetical protein
MSGALWSADSEADMLPYELIGPDDNAGARLAHLAPGPSWPLRSADAEPALPSRGGNGAGNGGHGAFQGTILNESRADFAPFNAADAGAHGAAIAHQTNWASIQQDVVQIGGVGGDGGSGNIASGGSHLIQNASGFDLLGGGGNGAGNGGDGFFAGSAVHTAVAVFNPVNIAVAGYDSHAQAHQTNIAQFDQGATQIAGVGGQGGNVNQAFGSADTHPSGGLIPALIGGGGSAAGNGGDGSFSGSLVHASFAVYHPVNIAIAGRNAEAHADQTNDVTIDQHAFQMAGVGGHGGHGNGAFGDTDGAALLRLIGSDVVAFGGTSSGVGGAGVFAGALADIDIAIYAPINIAVAGYKSTAVADQTNAASFDQATTQIAGVGGHGGDGNLAIDGDMLFDLLEAIDLLA